MNWAETSLTAVSGATTDFANERTNHGKYLALIGKELLTSYTYMSGDGLIFGINPISQVGSAYDRLLFDIWHTVFACWCSLGLCFSVPTGQHSQQQMFKNQYSHDNVLNELWQEFMGFGAPTGVANQVHIPADNGTLKTSLGLGFTLYGLGTENIVGLPFLNSADTVNKTCLTPFRTYLMGSPVLPYALFHSLADHFPTESHTYIGVYRSEDGNLNKIVVNNSALSSKATLPINNPIPLPLHGKYI